MTMQEWAAIWIWPDVTIRRKAQAAIDEAFWAALSFAVLMAIFATIGLTGFLDPGAGISAYMIAVIYGGIAAGIRARSRVAAVAGLVIYVADRIYFVATGGPRGVVIWGLILLAFWQGVRGTFAYAKLPPKQVGVPSIEDSFKAMAQGTVKRDVEQNGGMKENPHT